MASAFDGRTDECRLPGVEAACRPSGPTSVLDPIATSGLVSTPSAGLNRDARKRDEGFDRWAAAFCTRQCILKGRALMSAVAVRRLAASTFALVKGNISCPIKHLPH